MLQYLGRRAAELDLARVPDGDLCRVAFDDLHVVLDEDRGDVGFVQRLDDDVHHLELLG